MSGTYTLALESLVSTMFETLEKVPVLEFPSAFKLKEKREQIQYEYRALGIEIKETYI